VCAGCVELGQLSDEQLIAAASEIDDTLCLILKIDPIRPRTLAIEESLSNTTTKAWKTAADDAIDSSIKSALDRAGDAPPSALRLLLQKLAARLKKPLTADQIKEVKKRLTKIHQKAKRISSKAARVKFSFSQRDKLAIEAIKKHQVFWIGDFYNAHLSERIRAVSEELVLNRGLGSREAGRALREALRREFGIVAGGRTGIAPSIPARFAGNPNLYFRGVAATSAHQSRTFGSIEAFSEAKIISYQLINPGDDRTGQICKVLNGQVYSVQVGVTHMNRVLSAKDPRAIREKIAPWRSGQELRAAVGRSPTGSSGAASKLAAKGAILPPFHPLCRTEPVIVT